MSNNISAFQLLSGYWLWLIPMLWGYFLWSSTRTSMQNVGMHNAGSSESSSCIADVVLSVNNHYYHPLTDQLIDRFELSKSVEKPEKPKLSRLKRSQIIKAFAISLFVIALAQPVLIGERLPDPPPERDIVFLVDTSVSMQLMDYEVQGEPIQRMQLLHNLLDEFASQMDGERIAVIVFGEEPYMLVPLTNDQTLIRRMLGRITTTLAGRYSAVGDALLMALAMTTSDNEEVDRHQTFILFTDAHESQGTVTPSAAAELVGENDIPVFTVAIGSSLSSKTTEHSISGGLYQPVNHALLEDIARPTKGKSYQVHDSHAMQQALDDISHQRQNLAVPAPVYQQTNLYLYPLLLGLLILLLQQIVRLFSQSISASSLSRT
ncbi:MAG: VWA domain-containing protein [Thiotrichaceae bacterium]